MLLLVGLYYNEDLLRHTVEKSVDLELFNPMTEPGYRVLWNCLRDSYKTLNEVPNPLILFNSARVHIEMSDPLVKILVAKQVAEVAHHLGTNLNIVSRAHTHKLLKEAFHKAILTKLPGMGSNLMEADKLAESLASMSNTLEGVIPKQGVRKRPLRAENRRKVLRVRPRYKWGIDYWDAAGGSWYKKEIHGFLGPTGGGKTTNMVMVATRQIREGRKVAIALYEQALEEDVAQRIFANLAGISMNHLRHIDYDDIDPVIMDKINKSADQYQEYLVVLDMVGEDAGTGGVRELTDHLDEERRETGWYPDLVMVDWLGEMVQRYEHMTSADSAYRRTCEKFMSELNQYKENEGNDCTFLIFHQTNTQAQTRGPTHKPSKHDAHEFRSFPNKCDSCCVLGTMDRQLQVCWFIPGKDRRNKTDDRLIQLDGAYMRFNDVTEKFHDPGNGAFVENLSAGYGATQEPIQAPPDRSQQMNDNYGVND